jgi:hypothetical protein
MYKFWVNASGVVEVNGQEISGDIASEDVDLYADPTIGNDANIGSQASPIQTFIALMDAKPAIYHRRLRFHLNVDPTTAAINTTKKTYLLSNQALQFLFPELEGKNAETPYMEGGFTNELGDLTATAGTTSSLTTDQNLTLDQFKGAVLKIVSGPGAGQERIIRGNTVGPNSVVTPEVVFTVQPTNASVYRIGYPNVEIQFTQRLLFLAPSQNLFMKGIKFKFVGNTNGVDFQVGNGVGSASGGALLMFGWLSLTGLPATNKAEFAARSRDAETTATARSDRPEQPFRRRGSEPRLLLPRLQRDQPQRRW